MPCKSTPAIFGGARGRKLRVFQDGAVPNGGFHPVWRLFVAVDALHLNARRALEQSASCDVSEKLRGS